MVFPATALRVHPSMLVADNYVDIISSGISLKDPAALERYSLTARPVLEIRRQQQTTQDGSNPAADVVRDGAAGLALVLNSLLSLSDGDGSQSIALPNGASWSDAALSSFSNNATTNTSSEEGDAQRSMGPTSTSPSLGARQSMQFISSLLCTSLDTTTAPPATPSYQGCTIQPHLLPHVRLGTSLMGRGVSLASTIHNNWIDVLTAASTTTSNGDAEAEEVGSIIDQLPTILKDATTELRMAELLRGLLAYGEGLSSNNAATTKHSPTSANPTALVSPATAESIAQAHETQRKAWQVCSAEVLPSVHLLLLSLGGGDVTDASVAGLKDVVPVRMLVETCWSLLTPLSFLTAIQQHAASLRSKGVDIDLVQAAMMRLLAGAFDPRSGGNHTSTEFSLPLGTYMLLASLAGRSYVEVVAGSSHSPQRVPISPLLPPITTTTNAPSSTWELQFADLTVVHQMLGQTVAGSREAWKSLLVAPAPNNNTTIGDDGSPLAVVNGGDASSPIRDLRAQMDATTDTSPTGSPMVGAKGTKLVEERKALQKLLGVSRQIRDEAATMLAPYLYSISALGLHDNNAGSPILPARGGGGGGGGRKSESHGGISGGAPSEKSRSAAGMRSLSRLSAGGVDIGDRRPREESSTTNDNGSSIPDKRLRFEVGAGSPLHGGRTSQGGDGSGVAGLSPKVLPSIEVGGMPLPPLDLLRRQGILGDKLPPPPPMLSAPHLLNKGGAPAAPAVEATTLDAGANERARVFLNSIVGDVSSMPTSSISDLERFAVNRALIDLRDQLAGVHISNNDVSSPVDHLLKYVSSGVTSIPLTSRIAAIALLEACMRVERHSQPDSTVPLRLPEDVAAGSAFVSGPVVHYCRNAIQPLVEEGVSASALTPMIVLLIQCTVNTYITKGMARLCRMCQLLPLHSPLSYSIQPTVPVPSDYVPRCGGTEGRVSRALQMAAALQRILPSTSGSVGGYVQEAASLLSQAGCSLDNVRTPQDSITVASQLGGTTSIPDANTVEGEVRYYVSRGAVDAEVAMSRVRTLCCGADQCGACVALDSCRLCGEMDIVPTLTITALTTRAPTVNESTSLVRLCELDAQTVKGRVDSTPSGVDVAEGRGDMTLLLDEVFTPNEGLLLQPTL